MDITGEQELINYRWLVVDNDYTSWGKKESMGMTIVKPLLGDLSS